MSYYDIYNLRLNRYGNNYQSRIQTEREKMFDLYLAKSVYRVSFEYDGETHIGSLEKFKQGNTEALQYLLTNVHLDIPGGTILWIPDKNGVQKPWLVYYLEVIQASGYNRYIMLRLTHHLLWTARDGTVQESYAYMYGQEDNMLKNEIRSRSRMDTIYGENLKMSFYIMPRNAFIRRDDYFVIGEKPFQEYYRVSGYDIQSTDGVEYVTVDPVYEFDLTPAPEKPEPSTPEEDQKYFWFQGTLGEERDFVADKNNSYILDRQNRFIMVTRIS